MLGFKISAEEDYANMKNNIIIFKKKLQFVCCILNIL